MGSGLGAWEGSSARLSRLASVVVSSLAAVAKSGKTEGVGNTHLKAWAASQGPPERSKEGWPWGANSALGVLLCPEAVRGNPQLPSAWLQPAEGLRHALPPCSSFSHNKAIFRWGKGPAFCVGFKRPQKLGLVLGRIWGIGCCGEGDEEEHPMVLERLSGEMAQRSKAVESCTLFSHTSDWRRPGLSAPLTPVSRIQEILGADLDHMLQPRKGIRDHLRQVHCLHLHWAEGRC